MADPDNSTILNPGTGGDTMDELSHDFGGGDVRKRPKVTLTDEDNNPVNSGNPLPVTGTLSTGGLTDAELRASPVPVSLETTSIEIGTVDQGDPGASAWLVDGSGVTQPVSGPLTDTQLRAAPVDVAGPLTDAELRATPVPVSLSTTSIEIGTVDQGDAGVDPWLVTGTVTTGGLTDTQLRATPVPVSGTVTANAGTGTFAVSAAALPLPSGAATETTLATRVADATVTARLNTLGQKTMANSAPVVIASDQSTVEAHLNNATIEQVTGTATNNYNIQMGGVDGSGNLRPPLVDASTRRVGVDLVPSQSGVAAGTGTAGANCQRITIATNDALFSDLATILGWDSGLGAANVLPRVTYDAGTTDTSTQRVVLASDVALPAGTNALGVTVEAYAGTAADEQISVATATAVQVPSSIPSVPYRLIFSADTASTAAWKFRATTGTTFGHLFRVGQTIVIEMAASKAMFVSHDSGSSQNINVSKQPVS